MLRVTPLAAAMAMRQTPLTCSGHTRPVVDLAFSGITPYGYFLISACKGEPGAAAARSCRAVGAGESPLPVRARELAPSLARSDCVSHSPSSPVLVLVRRTVHCAFDTQNCPVSPKGFLEGGIRPGREACLLCLRTHPAVSSFVVGASFFFSPQRKM